MSSLSGHVPAAAIQVDNNVTRHLDSTLKRDDWDVLILHYLGLDHIGHISGPHSSLVRPKLLEMDDVLKKIHGSLVSKVSPFSASVACSDSYSLRFWMTPLAFGELLCCVTVATRYCLYNWKLLVSISKSEIRKEL